MYLHRPSLKELIKDGGAWWAAVHGVAKSRTRLSDCTFTFHFHALEKEMATHSSVLAWRIPGTGELGGLPSMGSHRVGHDWSDLAAAAAEGKNLRERKMWAQQAEQEKRKYKGPQLFQEWKDKALMAWLCSCRWEAKLFKAISLLWGSAHLRMHQADPGHDIAAPMGRCVCLGDWTLASRKRA